MSKLLLLMTIVFLRNNIIFLIHPPDVIGDEGTRSGKIDRILERFLSIREEDNLHYNACATCHGIKGDGNGPSAYQLDPKPREFILGVYKCRSTPSGSLPTDEDMFKSIKRGFNGTKMPSWKFLLTEAHIL